MANAQELAEVISSLPLSVGDYAVFGSGCLALHGIREANDVDIFVSTALYGSFEGEAGSWEEATYRGRNAHLVGDVGGVAVQLFCAWECNRRAVWLPDISSYLAHPEITSGVAHMPLLELRAWKHSIGLPKHLRDVAAIDQYLSIG